MRSTSPAASHTPGPRFYTSCSAGAPSPCYCEERQKKNLSNLGLTVQRWKTHSWLQESFFFFFNFIGNYEI